MKIIISHDVDHITFSEHYRDLIIPKYLFRNFIEFINNHISVKEMHGRMRNLLLNKWHNIDDLMEFNQNNNIPATFFVAVTNGKGLKYSLDKAELWIRIIEERGFDVGVHGIAYANFSDVEKEAKSFFKISGLNNYGIRMHYLRHNAETFHYLSNAGYLFDSSLYELKNPFVYNGMWEFPLHIMDVDIISNNARWQNQNLRQAQETTRLLIDNAFKKGIDYLTILFHDRFFNDSFSTWKEWYIWIINYLKKNDFIFINYINAIEELDRLRHRQEVTSKCPLCDFG